MPELPSGTVALVFTDIEGSTLLAQRLGDRYPDVLARHRELLRETARAHEMVVHAGSINRDHVHRPLSIPPSLSVSRAVQYLKGRSSHKLLSEFGNCESTTGASIWGPGVTGLRAAAT